MQKLMKTMGLCLFAVSLAACDGNKDSSTTPADNGSSAAAQPGASADGQTQVLGGKVSFNVPKGLQDQSGKSPSQTTNMAVFADNAAQKNANRHQQLNARRLAGKPDYPYGSAAKNARR
ncbi:hypothetical protein [Leminorella grimontii]|uniref:hypothetical protein n=1 Tax=Leminorella grimontii TaxID=82981 RepID=UPI00106A8BDF|nr:hypothetical protein [Leminorella grimontii]